MVTAPHSPECISFLSCACGSVLSSLLRDPVFTPGSPSSPCTLPARPHHWFLYVPCPPHLALRIPSRLLVVNTSRVLALRAPVSSGPFPNSTGRSRCRLAAPRGHLQTRHLSVPSLRPASPPVFSSPPSNLLRLQILMSPWTPSVFLFRAYPGLFLVVQCCGRAGCISPPGLAKPPPPWSLLSSL